MIATPPSDTPGSGYGGEGSHLGVAKDKLSCALKALTARDYARAHDLAEQAQMEAQMAERHAQSADLRKAAYESQAAARVLRREIDRIDALLFDHKPM